MKLHTSALSYNTLRCDLVLAEKSLDPASVYEVVPADLMNGSHKTPDFISKSLFGRVPCLEDGDLVLFESRAIGRYLAEKYKSVLPRLMPGDYVHLEERATWEMWFLVEVEEFNMHAVILNSQKLIQPLVGNKPDQYIVDRHTPKFFNCLDALNRHLATSRQDFIGGSFFSLVDINFMPTMYMLSHSFDRRELFEGRGALESWWNRVTERQSWKKVVKKLDDAYAQVVPHWRPF